jgi:hypothetical protein
LRGPASWPAAEGATGCRRDAFKKALVIYYSGETRIADAFAQVEPGLVDRYYRRKKKYPNEIERINAAARAIAMTERSSEQFAAESWKLEEWVELERRAIELVMRGLPELIRIIKGESKQACDRDVRTPIRLLGIADQIRLFCESEFFPPVLNTDRPLRDERIRSIHSTDPCSNFSNSLLACCKSRVSNPSVNQL